MHSIKFYNQDAQPFLETTVERFVSDFDKSAIELVVSPSRGNLLKSTVERAITGSSFIEISEEGKGFGDSQIMRVYGDRIIIAQHPEDAEMICGIDQAMQAGLPANLALEIKDRFQKKTAQFCVFNPHDQSYSWEDAVTGNVFGIQTLDVTTS